MRRYVIIGRSGSGKTTIINKLKKIGISTFDEVPRKVLEERAKIPVDNKENLKRQKIIFKRHLLKEKEFEEKGINLLIMERGLIDFIAYTNYLCGFIPKEFNNPKYNLSKRYNLIFNLENLPFVKDEIRIEKDEKEAEIIHNKVLKCYNDFRYSLIEIPKKSINKRVDLILEYIKFDDSNFLKLI